MNGAHYQEIQLRKLFIVVTFLIEALILKKLMVDKYDATFGLRDL